MKRVNFIKKNKKIKLKGKNIEWVNDLSNFKKKNCIILSNELIDAFPVKHLMKKITFGMKNM